jgi:hypothetical protein
VADKENVPCHSATPEGEAIIKKLTTTLPWVSFTSLLRLNKGSTYELEAFVTKLAGGNMGPVQSPRNRANAIAKAVWDATEYRFKQVIVFCLRSITNCFTALNSSETTRTSLTVPS